MKFQTSLTNALGIKFPMVMAPMFLVSNEAMVTEAMDAGICGAFPSLNFRKEGELVELLTRLNSRLSAAPGTYAVNLIVQKSNPLYEKHLKICAENKVPVFITSLGDPAGTIRMAHEYGGKVFCDVTNLKHAEMVVQKGCDGLIAVGAGAGGHAGPNALHLLVSALKTKYPGLPVLAAGGVSDGRTFLSVLASGADGASIGTLFIASREASVSDSYKKAVVDAGMDDIVMTEKISGTPCTIINTDFARKIGYRQNWLEKWLSRNKKTKKWFKTIVQLRGFKLLEKSAYTGSYDMLWCAGQSAEMVHEIRPVKEIIQKMLEETSDAYSDLGKKLNPAT